MSKIKYLVNMLKAYLLFNKRKKEFENRRIWIFGGNAGELFVDNGRAMFEYIQQNNEIESYWVINENSNLKEKITGNTLIKGSVDCYLHFMNSEVALFSHSILADIVPYLYVVPFMKKYYNKVLKVFLNHGTVGLKVRKAMNSKTEKIAENMVRSYNLNICDSNFEKNIKTKKWWNVPENTAFVTGYPRYDKLNASIENKLENKLNDIKEEKKEILFMPTWRNWIRLENKDIEKTEYFKNIIGLITNEKLAKYIEIKDIKFNIYIHQLMHDYLNSFEEVKLTKNITLLKKDTDITNGLIKSSILITDYSSVAYDYLYMNKPIIFFQFDKNEYESKVGSYVDFNNELFGEVAYDIDSCINKIVEIVSKDYNYIDKTKDKIYILRDKFLSYKDNKNSERVYELIVKTLEERGNINARK